MGDYHKPVLVKEVLELLNVREGKWYLDATLGDGGHSLEILKRGGNLVGLDHDRESLKRAELRIKSSKLKVQSEYIFLKSNFRDLDQVVGGRKFDGIIFDLGVSSNHFDSPERGFSFSKVGELDMRMDFDLKVRAKDLINGLNKGELEKLFLTYGEIRDKRVARAIVEARAIKPIETTIELAQIIEKTVGGRGESRIHPATLVFQALRIAVNDELNSIKVALPKAFEALEDGGKFIVISFHSLEDLIVKNYFKGLQNSGLGETRSEYISPSAEEIHSNPRSRSSRLRFFKKGR